LRLQGVERILGVKPKYNWTYLAIVTMFHEGRFHSLYKSFIPKVLRLAPGGGVLLLIVEFTLDVFGRGTFFLSI
jgi:solute carrier family 25 2-oxodicarboxylate transporter 21